MVVLLYILPLGDKSITRLPQDLQCIFDLYSSLPKRIIELNSSEIERFDLHGKLTQFTEQS